LFFALSLFFFEPHLLFRFALGLFFGFPCDAGSRFGFPLFFFFLVRLKRWQRKERLFKKDSEPSHWRQLLRFFPGWVIPAVIALSVYTFANFLLSVQHLPDHATTLTPLVSLYTVRAFSGHWLLFYAIPTIYFGFVPASAYPKVQGGDAAV